jgi:hypothetical protein
MLTRHPTYQLLNELNMSRIPIPNVVRGCHKLVHLYVSEMAMSINCRFPSGIMLPTQINSHTLVILDK